MKAITATLGIPMVSIGATAHMTARSLAARLSEA
jgi:hypothetical protein